MEAPDYCTAVRLNAGNYSTCALCMLTAGFSGAITIYPTNTMAAGTAAGFIDGAKYSEQNAGLTTAASGLKAIELELDGAYNDITGVRRFQGIRAYHHCYFPVCTSMHVMTTQIVPSTTAAQ